MARTASLPQRRKAWLVSLGLVVLVVLSYWPVFHCDFLIYDDWEYVVTNDMVRRGLTNESVTWAFQKFHTSNWHPLTWLSHMADVQLYGVRPMGHHATNLILHTANTLLLFGLLRGLTGSWWRSALVAALFGSHPTHVESVAWIAERKDVLSTFFGLLSLMAYARYAKASRADSRESKAKTPKCEISLPTSDLQFLTSGYYWLALLCLALGLMSKAMLVTWPFVMLLLDVWPLNRIQLSTLNSESRRNQMKADQLPALKRLLLEKIPFFALTIGSCVLTFLAQRSGGAVQSLDQLSATDRLGNAVISYVRYLGKTAWPADLSVYYPYPAAWSGWAISGAVLVLGILLTVAMLGIRQRPYIVFGLCWFLGTLVPVIGLVQVGGQSLADRYQYVPQIGLFIAIAWLLGDLAARRTNLRGPIVGLAVLAVLACSVLTPMRVRDWKNSETLFTQALRVTPGNYIAHNNLGLHYLDAKKYDLAIACFKEALALRPGYAATHNNLALALAALKKPDAAAEEFKSALRFRPSLYEARVNLANIYNSQNRTELASELLEEAVRVAPNYPEGHYSLANVRIGQGRLAEAKEHAQLALQLRPDYAEAKNCLGTIYLKQGKVDEAIIYYRAAIVANQQSSEAHNNLGLALASQKKMAEAIPCYEMALKLNPDLLSAHLGLAVILQDTENLEAAAQHWSKVLLLAPNMWEAHHQLGRILARQGKLVESLPHFEEAVRAQPNNAEVAADYGIALDQLGRSSQAVSQYQRALELKADLPEVLNNLAWIRAASNDPTLRNGDEAVRLAKQGCDLTEYREARFVGTLAAAYAESGRFDQAVSAGEHARELAEKAGAKEIAARNSELLELYRTGKPFREAAPPEH